VTFLPARQTDVIKGAVDLDERHKELWEGRDPKDMDRCDRPYPKRARLNNQMIAQGRVRRVLNGKHTKYYVKDPGIWQDEAVDVRKMPCPEGRIRCQFCGLDYEPPPPTRGKANFIACHKCSDLLSLDCPYPGEWDENRNLIQ
jgi:hypothetical protein